MKRFQKIYLEISNLCNLRCTFCPGTAREKRAMTEAEFAYLLPLLRPWTDYLYFHLMGEPLCHPSLERFLALAGQWGFRVILTTNGALLNRHRDMLLNQPALHKVNISLQSFEANDGEMDFREYLAQCIAFGQAARGQVLTVYRLWNQGGADSRNGEILAALEEAFSGPWITERRGTRMDKGIYLEHGEKFDWPDLTAPEGTAAIGCYGLRDQLGVLCDGTVVPCCLDHEGDLALGNLFRQSMEEILATPRAKAIRQGFEARQAPEELCRKCGYARRFANR